MAMGEIVFVNKDVNKDVFQLNVRPGGIWALGWGNYRCRGSACFGVALSARCALPLTRAARALRIGGGVRARPGSSSAPLFVWPASHDPDSATHCTTRCMLRHGQRANIHHLGHHVVVRLADLYVCVRCARRTPGPRPSTPHVQARHRPRAGGGDDTVFKVSNMRPK